MNPNILEVFQYFNLNQKIQEAVPFGSGHINDTYRLLTTDPHNPGYLLQRINHQVFKNVAHLMENINNVSTHISKKITIEEAKNGLTTLNTIPTTEGKSFHKDSSGNYWRIYDFLDNLKSYDSPQTTNQIYEGALSFGRFMNQLDDFPVEKLHVTIPRFNDIIFRLDNFKFAMDNDIVNRKEGVKSDIAFIFSVAEKLSTIQNLGNGGQIPLRVTHNDTKFNNVLLGEDNKGKCVIDLDTVMPGYVHYDFGDGVRTTINTTDEDEKNLDKVDIEMDRFEAFANGYLDMTREILTPLEINNLALSAPLFSFMMAVRFLTDYLSGDHYYKTKFEGHNLQRARCQLELTRKILGRLPDMQLVINNQVTKKTK